MASSRSTALLLTALCVVGIALLATIVPMTESGERVETQGGSTDTPTVVERLTSIWPASLPRAVILSLTVVVPVLAVWLVYTSRDPWKKVASLVVMMVMASLFLFLTPNASELFESIAVGNETAQGGVEAGSSLFAAVPFAVLLLAVAIVYGASESAAFEGEGALDADDQAAPPAVSDAAGRAADYIEAAEGDSANAIYDAWREMTAVLDVEDPESSTPGEFAAAAVDAGMDPGDVREITGLFEDVRYGEQAPSPTLERRAVAALRRIERTHDVGTDGEGGPSDTDTDSSGGATDGGE